MYEETFYVSKETAEQINFAKSDGRPVTACGTTVVRSLESAVDDECRGKARLARHGSPVRASKGKTNLFIYPPYEFKIPDRMITNFHLPRSTLLMLTSAFGGHDFLMRAYREAVDQNYRFYSYGDAMLIL